MPKASIIQTNFTAGEISPQLEGRVDITKYFNAAKSIENFLIAPFGGIDRRPGTQFVAPARYANKKVRLVPFQFSTTQTYMLEFGDLYIRFFRDEGVVTEAAQTITNITQANPGVVTTSGAHGYSNGDTVIITGVVGMTEINGRRFIVNNVTGTTFELQDIDAVNFDTTGFTAYTSGGSAFKVYEIASPYTEAQLFDLQYAQSADVLFLTHRDVQQSKLQRFGDTNWVLDAIDTIGGPYQPDNLGAITVTPSATTGAGITVTASAPLFNANMVGGLMKIAGLVATVQGYVKIVGFTSTTVVTADVIATLSSTAATTVWALGSFSDDAGYPSCVAFHEQRLWYGGTRLEPQTVKGSVTLEFENFTPGADDTDALDYQIATEQVNAIRWISSGRGLSIGTLGGVFILSTGNDAVPITPTNVFVRRETNYGSELIIPMIIGNFQYYVQRGKRKLREFQYNFDIDRHKAIDMNILADHITQSGIVHMDFALIPNSVLWAVRDDGVIATLTRQIEQEVIGWARVISGGTIAGASVYESVGIIPEGDDDQVWFSVKRTVDGVTRRHIEFMKPLDFGDDQTDGFFVDSGLTYDGPAETVFTGLEHLEGESVQVLADGAVIPNAIVTNGTVTLDDEAEKVHIGLGYRSEMETLRIEGGSATGTAQSKIKRVYEIAYRFYKTAGGEYGERDNTDVIPFRTSANPMNEPVPLFTGDKLLAFTRGYSRQGLTYIKQEQPLPMSILAVMPRVDVEDR